MDGTEFLRRFYADEGRGGSRVALQRIAENPTGRTDEEFNVWYLHIDADNDTLRFDHDFDPHEGTMPLSDFVDGLTTRLAEATG